MYRKHFKLTKHEVRKTIGINLKTLRISLKRTKQEIADCLGVSESTYRKIEEGEADLTIYQIAIICDYLKIAPNQLIKGITFGMHHLTETKDKREALHAFIDAMSPDNLEFTIEFITLMREFRLEPIKVSSLLRDSGALQQDTYDGKDRRKSLGRRESDLPRDTQKGDND